MAISQLSGLNDRDLVRRVARGDARAFEAIYDRHSSAVFGLAVRVTGRPPAAEEATQDAFLGLWRSAGTYDPGRGTLKTWLLGSVRNRSIDWLRREARHNRGQKNGDALVDRLEATERTDEQVAAQEMRRHTRQLLVSLPSDQRQVIELAYFKGLTHTEIAAKAGIPLGTVKGRQRLALAKLHRQLTRAHKAALNA